MKTIAFCLASVFGAYFMSGCAGTAVKDNAAAVAHAELCPTCKAKLGETGKDEKGKPVYNPVHDCPSCKAAVVSVNKGGKWVHEPAKGAAAHDCKMCKGE